MTYNKTNDDHAWDHIFSTISFDFDPPAKYIKAAVIQTKTGKKVKLTAQEYMSVMEQERQIDPKHAIVKSCRVTLDFEKLKTDIDRFALAAVKKAGARFRKSRSQIAWNAQLKRMNNTPNLDNEGK